MGRFDSRDDRTLGVHTGSAGGPSSAPSSISDMLYLIAAHHAGVGPNTAHRAAEANIHFIRGDLRTALASVDEILPQVEVGQPVYGRMVAFRIFLASMLPGEASLWPSGVAPPELASGTPRVVSLCVESAEQWNSGNLLTGLRLNQSAIEHCHDVAAMWRLYAETLLIKKLSDIHVAHQADQLIHGVEELVASTGLHAFGAVPRMLRSVLHLQAGRYAEAVEMATVAVRDGEQRASTVGVKPALAVAATAHLGLGRQDAAAVCLQAFHAQPSQYVMPDSLAWATFAEVALVAAGSGPQAAAERIRSAWPLLGTDSVSFVVDPLRPAWLVAVARRAGDAALAQRALAAIERLARDNRGVAVLDAAAQDARTAFVSGRVPQPSILDGGTGPKPRRQPPPAVAPFVSAAAKVDPVAEEPAAYGRRRLPALSRREDEIARLVGRGMTNRQVASQLGLSPHTVNFHLRSVYRKLSVSTRVALSQIIAQHDWRQEPPD